MNCFPVTVKEEWNQKLVGYKIWSHFCVFSFHLKKKLLSLSVNDSNQWALLKWKLAVFGETLFKIMLWISISQCEYLFKDNISNVFNDNV